MTTPSKEPSVDEPVTIHFKEDSIPGLRRGVLTKESKAQLLAHALSLKPERMDENLKEIKDPIESARAVGFNQGLGLWEQSLRKGYE